MAMLKAFLKRFERITAALPPQSAYTGLYLMAFGTTGLHCLVDNAEAFIEMQRIVPSSAAAKVFIEYIGPSKQSENS